MAGKLGFGMMRLPKWEQKSGQPLKQGLTARMVRHFLQEGYTYFDTAWMYCNFQSENMLKSVLTDRYPRDSFTVADKLHAGFLKTKEDRDRIFSEQLRKTGLAYFDYYLIHDVREEHYRIYNELDCFTWLQEKKKQGLVREIGFSFHDNAAFLEQVLSEHPEMEFVQLQLNYLDWEDNEVQSRACYEVARRFGKPIVVMEPIRGGKLANLPEPLQLRLSNVHPEWSDAEWALRFAASRPGVRTVLSGMSTLRQVMENTRFMKDADSLSEQDEQLLLEVAEQLRDMKQIPCTGCNYCTGVCPQKIGIPTLFSLLNMASSDARHAQEAYDADAKDGGIAASACIGCGQCEAVCPQELSIRELLAQADERFGD